MNHDSFMASLATLAGGNVLDITVASPASMVLGGSNVSLFNQHEGKPLTAAQLDLQYQRELSKQHRKEYRKRRR